MAAWHDRPMPSRRSLLAAAVALPLAHAARAVVDGVVDPNTVQSPFAGVGSLTLGGGTYSAVAIAPHFALTAAHVVAGASAASLTFNVNRGGDLVARLNVRAVHVHPGFHGAGPGGLMRDDLALLRLAEQVPFGTPAYEIARRAPRIGERLVFVGYGNASSSAGGAELPAHPAVKRIGSNVVEEVMPDPQNAGRIEMYRFGYRPLPGGSVLESTLAVGDSGSPAFVQEASRLLVVGINTFVYNSRAGRGGGGIVVAAHREWILAMAAAEGPR
jgi:hypothetical protein